MKWSRYISCLVSLAATILACGCIRDRAYRANPSVLNVPPEFKGSPGPPIIPPRPSPESFLPVGRQCDGVKDTGRKRLTPAIDSQGSVLAGFSGPCLGFIEFDDAGRDFVPGQVDRVTGLIRNAIEDDPQHQPIIITFIHGWKHNASSGLPNKAESDTGTLYAGLGSGEDSNIQGFEHVLDYLYTGFYKGHVVIGIYIAWHGDVISHYWPVARTISVYSREHAAIEVGKKVAGTLTRISNAAHPIESAGSAHQPMLVFVGHSFGGLMLQEAVNEAFLERLKKRQAAKNPDAVPTFADLIVFLNTAAPATEAVPVLNYLAHEKLEYREDDPNLQAGNGAGRNRPLLVSITTPADAATGLLFPIAFSASNFLRKITGSAVQDRESIECFDRSTSDAAPSVSSFSIQSAAQMSFIQSHELIDLGPPKTPGVLSTCPAAGSNAVYEFAVPGHCFQVQPKAAGHCNQTPYWIMTTDSSIIPDHGTIFTQRLLDLIKEFLPQSDTRIITPPRLTTPMERRTARGQSM